MNKSIDYESLFTYISLLLAFAIFIILMYGCLSNNYSNIENFTTTPTQPENAEIISDSCIKFCCNCWNYT